MIEITVPKGEVTVIVPAGETVILHGRKEAASSHHESHNVTSADSLLVGTFAVDQQGTITRHQPEDVQANGISVGGGTIEGDGLIAPMGFPFPQMNTTWKDANLTPSGVISHIKPSKEDILEALGR